jgi:hypothetical protein
MSRSHHLIEQLLTNPVLQQPLTVLGEDCGVKADLYQILPQEPNDAGFSFRIETDIARAAQSAGWEVRVATAPTSDAKRIIAEGFSYHPGSDLTQGHAFFARVGAVLDLTLLLRRLRPQLVRAVTIKPVLYVGVVATWARGFRPWCADSLGKAGKEVQGLSER